MTQVVDELREFEEYINNSQKNGKPIREIYEKIQGCSHVLPRLYLMCCVGGVFIQSQELPAKEILRDLTEMMKGEQNPLRGLFLRHYLSHTTKNRLPDIGTLYDGLGGNVQDAIDFVITNFIESNKLWVRLQSQGNNKDKRKREKERQDLKLLVGTNLVRLSQLEGLDINEYKNNTLPKILEQIVSCKDTIAQSYLMDCIIQVFPDEYHLITLEAYLKACTELREKVNVRIILESLFERLINYHKLVKEGQITESEGTINVNTFKLLNDCITTLIEERKSLTLAETLRLQTSLLTYALKCFSNRIDFVTHCLSNSVMLVEKSGIGIYRSSSNTNDGKQSLTNTEKFSADETAARSQLEALLQAPLLSLGLGVLDLPHFSTLIQYLSRDSWKEVASSLLRAAVTNNHSFILDSVEQVNKLFAVIKPLVTEYKEDKLNQNDPSAAMDEEDTRISISQNNVITESFAIEQHLVSKIVHLIQSPDNDTTLDILYALRGHFTQGGKLRTRFTSVPLVFSALMLSRRMHQDEIRKSSTSTEKVADSVLSTDAEKESVDVRVDNLGAQSRYSMKRVFQLVLELVSELASIDELTALKLFIYSALVKID